MILWLNYYSLWDVTVDQTEWGTHEVVERGQDWGTSGRQAEGLCWCLGAHECTYAGEPGGMCWGAGTTDLLSEERGMSVLVLYLFYVSLYQCQWHLPVSLSVLDMCSTSLLVEPEEGKAAAASSSLGRGTRSPDTGLGLHNCTGVGLGQRRWSHSYVTKRSKSDLFLIHHSHWQNIQVCIEHEKSYEFGLHFTSQRNWPLEEGRIFI